MRAQRAARFQSHLQMDRVQVAMVSFADNEADPDAGPLVGELAEMCSREEAREREMTRQLDRFEWKVGTDPKQPQVNLRLATRKYQRSSADKAYRGQDVRTLAACWQTMEFLMTEILDFDQRPKPGFAVQSVPYIEVYSYLRDRTRAVRVDLHLQQPRSTTQRVFAETHECCLRFEMLSLFILGGGGSAASAGSTERYDEKLGLKAISQTIEPLLNAYQAARDKQIARSILAAMGDFGMDDEGDQDKDQEYCSPWEMAVHRYILLLLMSFSSEECRGHMAKLDRDILSHPLVSFAVQAYAAFHADDYGRFLRLYRSADFLTAVAMSGVADLARVRALWVILRSYPQPVGDKLPLARLKKLLAFGTDAHAKAFLAFHGLKLADGPSGPVVVLPKKGTKEATESVLLNSGRFPEKCEYPKGTDSLLVAKYRMLGKTRAEIVFGVADPIVEVPEVSAPVPAEPVAALPSADSAPDVTMAAASMASVASLVSMPSATDVLGEEPVAEVADVTADPEAPVADAQPQEAPLSTDPGPESQPQEAPPAASDGDRASPARNEGETPSAPEAAAAAGPTPEEL